MVVYIKPPSILNIRPKVKDRQLFGKKRGKRHIFMTQRRENPFALLGDLVATLIHQRSDRSYFLTVLECKCEKSTKRRKH